MTTKRRKRHSPEQIVRKLRDADAMLNAGKDLAAVLQALGGQREHVRPLAEPVRRDEGRGGRAAEGAGGREQAAEAVGGRPGAGHPDAEARRRGKLVSPSRKREAVVKLQEKFAVSERRACRGARSAAEQSALRRPSLADDERALVKRMLELVRQRPRFGYRRIAALLRSEGLACECDADLSAVASGRTESAAKEAKTPTSRERARTAAIGGGPSTRTTSGAGTSCSTARPAAAR